MYRMLPVLLIYFASSTFAQNMNPRFYNIGNPKVKDIWVDPVNGNDSRSGATRQLALRTIERAWQRVPRGKTFKNNGYRLMLLPGTYPYDSVPGYWESRYGTYQFPLIIQAADGAGTVKLPSLNLYDCRYAYLIGLNIQADGGDILHCERCDHFLVRQTKVVGADPATYNVQETVKVNQSQYVYVENSDISGAWDNAIDFVAVQYGHVQSNKIHNAGDWCLYTKGGSAYFRIEGNEIYDCGTGGYTAGQGTGFEFMNTPWLHYEAYDVKFINNVIHDTEGAGFGVNGGYNILLAYNTMYRVGRTSHGIEVGFGSRGCDGNTAECQKRLNAGGWGMTERSDGTNEQPIPNRNVYIYNNILYNPSGYRSQYQHFAIAGPRTPANNSNIPSPSQSDTNLQIRGNIIWNGPKNMLLGIEASSEGCRPSNSTCNANQLRKENSINKIQPQLTNPANGDFVPTQNSNVYRTTTYAIPDFSGGDRPQPPIAPQGNLKNEITRDRTGAARTTTSPPGAYVGG